MIKHTVQRTITVDIIRFEDGQEIDADLIFKFIEDHCELEDTIGKGDNWTDEYLFFNHSEKLLEPILLKMGVIKKAPTHVSHNNMVDKRGGCYRYWLSDGYQTFRDNFYNIYNGLGKR